MKKYSCEVTYRNPPCFTVELSASCSELAKLEAINMASRNGFNGRVKSVKVRLVK